jgi:RND family efflux transporter MFP subunit
MKRIHLSFLLTLLVFSLLVAGCGSKKADKASVPETKKIPVTVEIVKKGNMEKSIPLGGLLQPQDEVALASKNPAFKILKVPVRVGDGVKAGTPLVVFDGRDIELQIRSAQDSYNDAKLNYERNKELYDAGAIAKSLLEQAELRLSGAEIALNNLRIQQENTVLISPINGVVSAISAVEGQLAGSMPLVSVVNIDKLKLQVQVGEAYINKLRKGGEMQVSIPAASKESFTGIITNIAPQIDARTKAYPVTLEVENAGGEIKGGMYGEVQLVVDRKENVIVIPQYAILDQDQKKVVYIVENDTAKRREVEVGLTLGDKAEIVKGLNPGEALMVEGQYGVKDGSPVIQVIRGEAK